MCTNVLVLHIFIDCSHDGLALGWNPAQIFYERLRRRILSKVGDRFAYSMGCWIWHGEKKIGKMDPLALYLSRIMVSSGFTRSTCLLNCLMPELTQSSLNSNCIWLNYIFSFGILIHLPTYLPVSIMHYLHRLHDWWESSKQYSLELPPLPLLLTIQIT